MAVFSTKKHGTYTVIAGCGRLGASLADALSDNGESVLILDRDRDAFRKLSPSFGGLTLEGDGTDPGTLKEADIDRADVLLAVTDNDNVNIMIAQMAKEFFRVDRVIARLSDPEHACICEGSGIGTICPAVLSAHAIGKLLSHPEADTQNTEHTQEAEEA